MREASVASRFEALRAGGLTELVGREEELEVLLQSWSKAKTGEGQVVLISGEAGIGKSRLTVALLEHFATEPNTHLSYFCSPQHTDSALYPIISQMGRAARLTHDDTNLAKLDKLDALLARTSTPSHDAALFADMLSLQSDGHYPTIELTSEQRRKGTLEALVSLLTTLTEQSSVLMIFEDAHWSDPTSLELFGRIVDRIPGLPILLIVTFRPEFNAPWTSRHYVLSVTINRLAERDIAAMVDRVASNQTLPANIRQDIIKRTDGIPLFIEEITKAVLEAAAQEVAPGILSATLTVPATLQASLMARLDRPGSAKEVAQIGALIGRSFSHELISAVAQMTEQKLNNGLEELVRAELIFRRGFPPHAEYTFKHTLVQDAAYSVLLRARRHGLHASIAQVLVVQFPDRAENEPELLAHHFAEAGFKERAIDYWLKAGQHAMAVRR